MRLFHTTQAADSGTDTTAASGTDTSTQSTVSTTPEHNHSPSSLKGGIPNELIDQSQGHKTIITA